MFHYLLTAKSQNSVNSQNSLLQLKKVKKVHLRSTLLFRTIVTRRRVTIVRSGSAAPSCHCRHWHPHCTSWRMHPSPPRGHHYRRQAGPSVRATCVSLSSLVWCRSDTGNSRHLHLLVPVVVAVRVAVALAICVTLSLSLSLSPSLSTWVVARSCRQHCWWSRCGGGPGVALCGIIS